MVKMLKHSHNLKKGTFSNFIVRQLTRIAFSPHLKQVPCEVSLLKEVRCYDAFSLMAKWKSIWKSCQVKRSLALSDFCFKAMTSKVS